MATEAGNASYDGPRSIPAVVPVFPLSGALLLPRGQMPLNIFEPRYIAMIDAAMRTERVIGMIQPRFDDGEADLSGKPNLCEIGCLGRVTQWAESGDGRYLVTLTGITRFKMVEELATATPYRMCRITAEPFERDFAAGRGETAVDRKGLLKAFRAYLEANGMDADWDSVDKAGNEALVNALSMMSPYGPAEKQALLEADDLKTRAETLVAITEVMLAKAASSNERGTLQ